MVSVWVGGGGGADVSVFSLLSFDLSFFGLSVDVVSVVWGGCVDVVVLVSVVPLVPLVSLLVVVSGAGGAGGGGRRGVLDTTMGAGCGGTRTGGAPLAMGAGGGGEPAVIAPGCCGGSTPVAGPPGMFAAGAAVLSVKLPVVSVFVAVAAGGRTGSPGAPTDVVALVVCPSWITSYCC
jgi:hypothetical protein